MYHALRIPTVTLDDLQAFRARIFKDVPEYSSIGGTVEEEDDGLGYYADGVKRTLTDDQVTMFRHSEIYAIIRERQIKREQEEADHGQTEVVEVAGEQEASKAGVDEDSDDEEEYARFLEVEQKEMEAEAAKKGKTTKRKRNKLGGNDEHARPPTMRRIAREMDEATAKDTVLDYGEEDASAASGRRSLDRMNGQTRVSYEDEGDSKFAVEQRPNREGRKIWWPTIGIS